MHHDSRRRHRKESRTPSIRTQVRRLSGGGRTVYAYATFDGVEVRYQRLDDEARRMFAEDLATWLAHGRAWPHEWIGRNLSRVRESHREYVLEQAGPAPEVKSLRALTVRELVHQFIEHTRTERPPEWWVRNEPRTRLPLEALVEAHGDEPAAEFGPKRLKALQAHLCELKRADGVTPRLTVKTVNERIRAIVSAFTWAVSEELIPAAILEGLRAVQPIRQGKPGTRGSRKIDPVPWEHVEAVLPFLRKPTAALVLLLWWTGARPGELLNLRPQDIDRSSEPWTVRLERHKTAWKGKSRKLFFGPEAQRVLEPFLLRPPHRPMFRPAEAMAELHRERRAQRATPLFPSHRARYERERAARAAGAQPGPGETYDGAALRKAVLHALRRCNRQRAEQGLEPVPAWHPYRLRHSAATRIRAQHGIEAARVLLGHTSAGMTEVYAEADLEHAAKVALQTG